MEKRRSPHHREEGERSVRFALSFALLATPRVPDSSPRGLLLVSVLLTSLITLCVQLDMFNICSRSFAADDDLGNALHSRCTTCEAFCGLERSVQFVQLIKELQHLSNWELGWNERPSLDLPCWLHGDTRWLSLVPLNWSTVTPQSRLHSLPCWQTFNIKTTPLLRTHCLASAEIFHSID